MSLDTRTCHSRTPTRGSGGAFQPERCECVVHRRMDRHRNGRLQNSQEPLHRPSAHECPRMSVLPSAYFQFFEDAQAGSAEELDSRQVEHDARAFEVVSRKITQRRRVADVDLSADGDMNQVRIHPTSRELGSGRLFGGSVCIGRAQGHRRDRGPARRGWDSLRNCHDTSQHKQACSKHYDGAGTPTTYRKTSQRVALPISRLCAQPHSTLVHESSGLNLIGHMHTPGVARPHPGR